MLKISVVTPSYNQCRFIPDALESVCQQGYAHVEHIVLDNCSTDGTKDILKKYSQGKVICEPDQGQSDALNKGFKMAQGDIIGWLNADDRYLGGCFQKVAKFFEDHPQCDVLYGNYRLIGQSGDVLSLRQELPFDIFMLKYLHVLYIPSTTCFFRRRIFEEGEFLDLRYHYAMDYEYFLRLALKGYRFYYMNEFLADFRTHSDSKSQRQAMVQKQEMEEALLTYDPFLQALQNPWRKFVRYALMLAARSKRLGMKFFKGAYFQ